MSEYKKYNEFLLCESKRNKKMYKMILHDIQIDIDVVIDELKNLNINCWPLYNHHNSMSLGYFKKSDDSEKNIMRAEKFLMEKLPYFKGLSCYKDDNRIVIKFIEVGEPVHIKFYFTK